MNIFSYTFFQHALLGSVLTSVACGFIGSYIVARRLVLISGGITHASFGGLGLGFFLGIDPILSAMFFSVLSAFGIEWLSRKQEIREDSAIAVVWSLGMALGIIFIFLTPGYSPDLSAYLFGSILTISTSDLWLIGIIAMLLFFGFSLFSKTILYVAFDREFSKIKGIKVERVEYLMMLGLAVTLVASIRLTGVMLLMSLMTIPQITANIFTNRFGRMVVYSILFGIAGCLGGLFISYYLNIPSGAAIIFVQVIFFIVCRLIRSVSQRVTFPPTDSDSIV